MALLASTSWRGLLAALPVAVALVLAGHALPAIGQGASPAPPAPQTRAKPATHAGAAPAWSALTPAQQAALQPLAPIWHEIGPNRKRKWIALSAGFGKLSATEQATLHVRMGDWARLSNQERNRARLGFAETRTLSSEEKKARWEAYQALSPVQKQQLARQAASRPTIGAAPAITNRSSGKLAAVPVTRSDAAAGASSATPRPATDHGTRAPATGASATPASSP